jgi:hypothetical protein
MRSLAELTDVLRLKSMGGFAPVHCNTSQLWEMSFNSLK